MKCAFCQGRKGKRVCKLVARQEVCSACCGQQRTEACEGCGYYAESLRHQAEKRVRAGELAVELTPDGPEARCDLALALAEQGHLARAGEILAEVARSYPEHPHMLFGEGVLHLQVNDYKAAIACFARAIDKHPHLAEAHYNLGSAYLQLGDLKRGVEGLRAAIDCSPRLSDVAKLARTRLDDIGETIERMTGLSLAVTLDNQAVFERGVAALDAHRLEEAISLFEEVLSTDKRSVQSHGNLGIAQAHLGHKAEALASLDRALALDPNYELALVNRAVVSRMSEGEPLGPAGGAVNYYSEYPLKGRSYLQEVVEELEGVVTRRPEP